MQKIMTLNGWPIPVNPGHARTLLKNWGRIGTQAQTKPQPDIIAKLALLEKRLGIGAAAIVAPMMLSQFAPGLDAHEVVKTIAMLLASAGGAKGMAVLENAAETARKAMARLHS